MRRPQLKNIIWKEGRYYVAQCLNIDVSSFGKTRQEALANLNEALTLYFEDAPAKLRLAEVDRPKIVSSSL